MATEFCGRKHCIKFSIFCLSQRALGIYSTYAQKRNNAQICELKKPTAGFKKEDLSIGKYYAKFRSLWREMKLYLSPEPCCAKKQAK